MADKDDGISWMFNLSELREPGDISLPENRELREKFQSFLESPEGREVMRLDAKMRRVSELVARAPSEKPQRNSADAPTEESSNSSEGDDAGDFVM